MAIQNYGTTTYPCKMNNPALTVDPTNPTPASRVEEACISAINWLKVLDPRKALWIGASVPTISDLPNAREGDSYIQTSGLNAMHLYVLTENTWVNNGSMVGPAGSNGTKIFHGTAVTGTSGQITATVAGASTGDFYLNDSTKNFYICVGTDTWNYMTSFNGAPGSDGISVTGATINVSGHLILTLSNSSTIDCGVAKGTNGTDGVGSGWTTSEVTGSTPSVTFAHGNWYRCTNAGITTLTVTSGLANIGDTAVVWFTSPAGTASTYSTPSTIYHKGDACSSGTFTPAAGHRYTLTFIKDDGGLVCLVMEV